MKLFLISLILMFCTELFGQSNLVRNPSFEECSSCPSYIGQLYVADFWSAAHGSLDYYSSCSDTLPGPTFAGVPWNIFGYQNAHTGVAYAGFVSYVNPVSSDREYMQTLLLEPLIAGEEYTVSFYLNLADSKITNPVGPVGVYFTNDTVATPWGFGNLSLCCAPQITFSDFPTDIDEWMLLSTNYIASGGERLMVIGNFETNGNCIFIENPDYAVSSYFFIDDVSVTLANNTGGSGPLETIIKMPNVFSPDNDYVNDIFHPIVFDNVESAHLFILNRWGEMIFETDAVTNGWDGTANEVRCSEGTYFWQVEYIGVNGEKGLKNGFVQLAR